MRPGRRDLPFLVGIGGGSGSGKTALAGAIADLLGRDRVAVFAQDAYYRDRADVPPAARSALNFDVPEALDQTLFLDHLRALRRGAAVRPPRYCFATHARLGLDDAVEPRAVVLVEGILLFADPHVCEQLDLRVFVDAPAPVRLERRIHRDADERGRPRASVVRQYETTVRPAHDRYVEPTRARADLVLLNVGRLAPLAEIAATVIRDHLDRRRAPAVQESAA